MGVEQVLQNQGKQANMKLVLSFVAVVALGCVQLYGQTSQGGTISGTVVDESTKKPMEFVNVLLRARADSSIVAGKETDSNGRFAFTNVSAGEYFIRLSIIGYKERNTPLHAIDGKNQRWNLGTVTLTESSVSLDEVLVTAQRTLFTNSIDRKVYNVGQDIMSKSGSTSELLQSIPSVEVDIDGNVSLRGSSSVLILVNGKSSPLMAKSSATVLQQMPASSIERIELITNPSAKYKPDGTSGIINIVLKKNAGLGTNGSIGANVGNNSRFNGNVRLNYNPGSLNLFGSYSIRSDNRNRITADARTQLDALSQINFYREDLRSYSSPLSHMVVLGLDYEFDPSNSAGMSGNYYHNGFTRSDNSVKVLQDARGMVTSTYGRNRLDPEYEEEYGVKFFAEHKFPKKGQKVRLEVNASRAPEVEDNRYTDFYTFPTAPNQYENALIKQSEEKFEIGADYSDPVSENASFEAGYSGEKNKRDMDFRIDDFDNTRNQFLVDVTKSNRFVYDEFVHALYITYERSMGSFGFMAGMRAERALITSNLVTLDSIVKNNYFSLFPTVHVTYTLNRENEVRLSYSRRVRRPEGDDLNPFPEYRDPRNISSGNPKLRPEYVHSVELGFKFETDVFTILPSIYYRYTYDRFTQITQLVNDTILLTTRTNLSNDQSTGLELILSADLGELVSVHGNTNVFFNQIDASNLGFSQHKSITTWSGALTMSLNFTKSSMAQINSNYSSRRLTPQGEVLPSYVVNLGLRQELITGKLSVTATIADVFRTLRRESSLSTPLLQQNVINSRDSRVFFVGVTYTFGVPPKKSREESLRYDDSL